MSMLTLTEFADYAERVSRADFAELPGVKFRKILEEAAVNHRIPQDVARTMIIKMKVDISEFDEDDDDWIRIVNAYAVMLKKLYDIYGKDIFHFEPLSIEYRV